MRQWNFTRHVLDGVATQACVRLGRLARPGLESLDILHQRLQRAMRRARRGGDQQSKGQGNRMNATVVDC
ncbi:hypothetical protein JCM10831_09880 [Hydrogenophilus hirschii]